MIQNTRMIQNVNIRCNSGVPVPVTSNYKILQLINMSNQDNTSANKRIARNSLFMTIRMIVVLIISLYTTRAILGALGVEDYGIYNVVCGFVSMFAFMNSSMTGATQRFYNYELGKHGAEGVRKVYNAAIIIHLSLAALIVVVTEIVGLWYIQNKLVVPPDRLTAAIWIFHFSLFSLFLNIINVPYTAVIIAHERMNYYAIIGIADAVLKLAIVFVLYAFSGDKLILYGALFLLIILFDFLAYRIYAMHHFKELMFGIKPTRDFFKEMLSYAGWNLFGSFAYMMRDQGINLLLNSCFGPIVNAARGIANQVNGALAGFSGNILAPAQPQIIQSYAAGEHARTYHLTYSISKLSCLVFLVMSLPICFEIDPILSIWLGDNVPEHASSFIIIMLITNTWGSLIAPVSTIMHATGKMQFYQTISSLSNLMSVPLAYIFLVYKPIPEFVFIALLITMFTNHIAALISVKKMTSFSIIDYTKAVVLPLAAVILLSIITASIPHYFIENAIADFIVVSAVSICSVLIYSYFICFDSSEKQMIASMIKKLTRRY